MSIIHMFARMVASDTYTKHEAFFSLISEDSLPTELILESNFSKERKISSNVYPGCFSWDSLCLFLMQHFGRHIIWPYLAVHINQYLEIVFIDSVSPDLNPKSTLAYQSPTWFRWVALFRLRRSKRDYKITY